MERKIKQLLLVTGSVLSAAVALVPMSSYAAYSDFDQSPDTSGNTAVKVNVLNSISLDAASAGSTVNVSPETVGTGTISASVSSTAAYTISLKAVSNANLVNKSNSSATIPAGTNVRAGNSAWGIKKPGASTYTALTTSSQVFYNGTGSGANNSIKTDFPVGVSVNSTVPGGTYSTEIEVLAALNS